MAGDDRGFLSRWSQRKLAEGRRSEGRRAGHGAATPAPGEAEPLPQPPVAADPPSAPASGEERERVPELPDISTLTGESDFTGFLREGVPEELHRLALRKLWLSDPTLANLDGLNDYDGDFRSPNLIGQAVRTAWQVGKGYIAEPEDAETAAPGPEAPPPSPSENASSEAVFPDVDKDQDKS